MKVAIVGVGGMGGLHFNIYKDMPGFEFVAACDVRLDMLKEKAEGMNINLYSDYDEMLEKEKPDLVDVSTPTYIHKEYAIKALEKGINVICEKPMAVSSDDAKEIIEAAEKSGKMFMAAHVVRFMRAYVYLADAVKSGKYGKLVKLYMKRISATPNWSWENWMMDREKSGHVALDLAIHDIDFMQSLLGDPEDISGVYYDMKGNSNAVTANYIYKDFSVSVEGAWFNADIPFNAEYCAVFENGFVELKNGVVSDNGNEVEFDNDDDVVESTGINLSNVDGYSDEILYFIDCIKNGKAPERVTPQSSLRSVQLVEETLKKVKTI